MEFHNNISLIALATRGLHCHKAKWRIVMVVWCNVTRNNDGAHVGVVLSMLCVCHARFKLGYQVSIIH